MKKENFSLSLERKEKVLFSKLHLLNNEDIHRHFQCQTTQIWTPCVSHISAHGASPWAETGYTPFKRFTFIPTVTRNPCHRRIVCTPCSETELCGVTCPLPIPYVVICNTKDLTGTLFHWQRIYKELECCRWGREFPGSNAKLQCRVEEFCKTIQDWDFETLCHFYNQHNPMIEGILGKHTIHMVSGITMLSSTIHTYKRSSNLLQLDDGKFLSMTL